MKKQRQLREQISLERIIQSIVHVLNSVLCFIDPKNTGL